MLRVRELAELTRGLDAPAFAKQMGPFALMQRPPSEARVQQGRAARGATAPLPVMNEGAAAPVEFEELQVATLPPPQANGLMRLVIGRSPECDLVVDDPAVSARHAVIHWNGTAGVLIELGSSNGTIVNGKAVPGDAPLASGDQLTFGRSHFVYYLADALHERLKRAAR
jgi:hypothetical protein